jgi:hypothetical protein
MEQGVKHITEAIRAGFVPAPSQIVNKQRRIFVLFGIDKDSNWSPAGSRGTESWRQADSREFYYT